MKTPPLLLAAALLFWGWQTGLWLVAIPLAALLEGARLFQARWEFSEADFTRIWNLCTILFLGALVVGFFSKDSGPALPVYSFDPILPDQRHEALTKTSRAVLLLFQWLPVVFLPIIAAQVFSTREKIPLTSISWLVRRQFARDKSIPGQPPPALNISYCYFAACLMAASTVSSAHRPAPGFYWGLAALLIWALWPQRNKRFSPALWAALLSLAILFGYAGQQGILHLQKLVEQLDSLLLSQFGPSEFDPKESRTMLGAIGKLKLSGRIVLRLKVPEGPPPPLLREASYSQYKSGLWFVSLRDFGNVYSENDLSTWNLLPDKISRRSAIISKYLKNGRGLLPIPLGVSQLQQLPVFLLETNRFGVLKATGPGLVSYLAQYDNGASIDTPPGPEDLYVPETEEAAVTQIAEQLNLAGPRVLEAANILRTIAAFFQKNFSYSTWLPPATLSLSNQTALAAFLLNSRRGHCEYFATATVLLLRKAGIHARYAVGYSVQEGSGKNYVVRQRDAHAWCLAWYQGAWHDVDTTPADWHSVESQHASFWQPISDFFSRLWFEFSKWRWGQSGHRKYVFWVLIPLILLTLLQLLLKKQWVRLQRKRKTAALARDYPGLDSEFYQLLQRLATTGKDPQPGETLLAWLSRIESSLPLSPASLQPLVKLHYQLRFDPLGLSTDERATLKTEVAHLLSQFESKPG